MHSHLIHDIQINHSTVMTKLTCNKPTYAIPADVVTVMTIGYNVSVKTMLVCAAAIYRVSQKPDLFER